MVYRSLSCLQHDSFIISSIEINYDLFEMSQYGGLSIFPSRERIVACYNL
jgi:hypothetical protein